MTPDLDRLRIDRRPEQLGPAQTSRRRWLLALGAGLLVLVGAYFLWGLLRPAQEVSATVVSRVYPSQGYTLLNASGYVVPQRKAAVSSKSTGRLVFLGVEEGSRVKKGQVVASLENEDLVATRNQAEAQVREAEAQLATAQAELTEAHCSTSAIRTHAAENVQGQEKGSFAQTP